MTGVASTHPRLHERLSDDHPGSGATNPRVGTAPLMCTDTQLFTRDTAPCPVLLGAGRAGLALVEAGAVCAEKGTKWIGKERSALDSARSAIPEKTKGTGIDCIADAINPRAFDDGPESRPGKPPAAEPRTGCPVKRSMWTRLKDNRNERSSFPAGPGRQ